MIENKMTPAQMSEFLYKDLAFIVREWIALTNYSPEKTRRFNGVGTD